MADGLGHYLMLYIINIYVIFVENKQ